MSAVRSARVRRTGCRWLGDVGALIVVALLSLSSARCFQDLFVAPRQPTYGFTVTPDSIDADTGRAVSPFSAEFKADGRAVPFRLGLRVVEGTDVARVDSGAWIQVLRRGTARLEARPLSTALTTDAIVRLLTLRAVVPPSVTGPGQFKSNGATVIAVGGSTDEATVLFKATPADPDPGATVRFLVEVRPLGTAFTNSATDSSAVVASGGTATVTKAGLADDTGYHWQYRACDETARCSPWTPFGGNAESSADFLVAVPEPPSVTGPGQYQSDCTTAIVTGGTATALTVCLKTTLSDPDPGATVRFLVEVRPLGTAFTNSATDSSAVVASGGTATVTKAGLADDTGYHWQYRACDETARCSPWTPFGGNAESSADFLVPVRATTAVVTPAAAAITGGTQTFTAQALDVNGDEISGKTFTWASLNPNVATINSSTGVATAVASGQVTISAEVDGKVGYALLTVAIPGATPVNLWVPTSSGTTADLHGVWGTSSTNVYAVGLGGAIRRWEGAAWAAQSSGTTEHLGGVWGTSATNVFAVGDGGTILRFDGTNWTRMTSPTGQELDGVWGASPTNVFATGRGGTILRWDGSDWAVLQSGTSGDLPDVWGTSAANVYAVGGGGAILRYDGTTWSSQTSGTTAQLQGVWGPSPANVFAVGFSGTILRWDGSTWATMTSGTTEHIGGVWGTSPANLHAVGASGAILSYEGTAWTSFSSGTALYGLWGAPGSDVYAVGGGGTILRGVRGATVTLTPASPTLTTIGATQQMTATARDAGSNTISGVTFTWTSSNTAVATVSSTGLVTAVASGTATINATAPGGASGSTTVTVAQVATSVVVTPAGAAISGGTQSFTAQARDSLGNAISGKTFAWASLNPNVATINSSTGIATAVASGQVTVSATADGKVGYALLTVAIPGATPVNLWTSMASGVQPPGGLGGVWGVSSDTVFAVGSAGPTTPILLRYTGSGWQQDPSSELTRLSGVWGTSYSNVYAVGAYNAILHYNGATWTRMPSGTPEVETSSLGGHLWGSAPNDIYAAGGAGSGTSGFLIHYDGNQWTPVSAVSAPASLYTVWGTSRDTAWVFGEGGRIFRLRDGNWSQEPSVGGGFIGIWGSRSSSVYATDYNNGQVFRFDGTNWTLTSNLARVYRVWGSSDTDIYAVGADGVIWRFNGTSWDSIRAQNTTDDLTAIWGTSSGSVYVVGQNGTILRGVRGATVSVTPTNPTLTAIGATQQMTATARDAGNNTISGVAFTWSSSNTAVATVNSSGLVTAVANGTATITATAPGGASGSTTVTVSQVAASVVVTPAGAAIAGGTQTFTGQARDANGNVISGKTFTWASLNPNVATINSSTGVAAAVASGQVTVSATADGVMGYALLTVAIPGATPPNLWAPITTGASVAMMDVWGTSASNVFAVGQPAGQGAGTISRYDGTTWSEMPAPGNSGFVRIRGLSASDVYAVGNFGTLVRYDGTSWTAVSGTSQHLWGVWAASPTAVYAVGDNGTILRFNGSTWSPMTSGTTQRLNGVWGTSVSDVYVVGNGGTILRFDGTAWSSMTSGTGQDLMGVWGTSSSDVFAAGYGGAILRFNGAAWSGMASGTTLGSGVGIWGTSASDVYAGYGTGRPLEGLLLRYDGSSWSSVTTGTIQTPIGIWGIGSSDVFAGAGIGVILRGVRGATVTVTPATPTLTAIGATQQMAATARDASSNTISGVTFTWSSSNTAVATVNSSGLVTAVANGAATITATAPGGAAGSTTVTVAPNFALDFSNDYVEIADAPSLDLGAAWTLETWVYPRNVGATGFHHVISKWGGAGNASYTLEVRAGRLRGGIHDGTTSHVIESDSLLASAVWQHLAIVFESGTVRLYINGTLDTSAASIPAPMNSTSPVRFGAEAAELWTYDGLIDEIRVWNVARTSAQIAAARTQRLAGNETGLVGYWRFDEGAGDSAGDATANGNHGRLGGAAGADGYDPTWVSGGAPVTTAAASANLRLASGRSWK